MKDQPEAARHHTYFDSRIGKTIVKVAPGDYYTTGQDCLIVTVLGSCVAACLYDGRLHIGGMNHFMLPIVPARGGGTGIPNAAYGMFAMEVLIGDLVKRGSRRENLRVKVFGGAAVSAALANSRVGEQNAEFVLSYLQSEDIEVTAADLLGVYPRKLHFCPLTGRVDVNYVRTVRTLPSERQEFSYSQTLAEQAPRGDVELF